MDENINLRETAQEFVNSRSTQEIEPSIVSSPKKKSFAVAILSILLTLSLGVAGYFAYVHYQKPLSENMPQEEQVVKNPIIISNDSKLLYSYQTSEGLVIAEFGGEVINTLYEENDPYLSWDWSPSADKIVINTNKIIDIRDKSEIKIPPGRCHNWSPDGIKIIYVASGGLYMMDSNGENQVLISESGALCGGSNSVHHWFPNSKKFMYQSYVKDNTQSFGSASSSTHSIEIYDLDSKKSKSIFQEDDAGQIRNATISNDGKYIAFMMTSGSNRSTSVEELYSISTEGEDLIQLTNLGENGVYRQPIGQPVFGSEGKHIFLIGNNNLAKYVGLLQVEIKSKLMTNLSNKVGNAYSPPSISPDGRYVSYDAFEQIITVDIEEKNIVEKEVGTFVLWQK